MQPEPGKPKAVYGLLCNANGSLPLPSTDNKGDVQESFTVDEQCAQNVIRLLGHGHVSKRLEDRIGDAYRPLPPPTADDEGHVEESFSVNK